MNKQELIQKLMNYFDIGTNNCMAYNLTRVKEARQYGTLTIDDFVEFDEETIDDIVNWIFKEKISNNEVCHCETDLNKVSEIMKEREEKSFKYDCLIKQLKEDNEKDRKTVQYYEETYRNSKSEYDKKSYKRTIDMANARREVRKEIIDEII